MCGIVGYIGPREATGIVVGGLQRLEYRGYDSAGIAVLNGSELQLRRSVGKLHHLTARLQEEPTVGRVGIGHTRWATHGGVTEDNAHPHRDQSGRIVVIQNGIVENYLELKQRLLQNGHSFLSQTDTEVIAHLVGVYYREEADLAGALGRACQELRGGNAIVALCVDEPDLIVAARLGNAGAVVIGLGERENFVASDMPAILDYTQRLMFLDSREMAVLRADSVAVTTIEGQPVAKTPTAISWDPVAAAKGGYKHFMLKEIHEQPRALTDVLRGRLDVEAGQVVLDDLRLDDERLRAVERVYAVACGTAWHACLMAKFYFETLAGVRVDVDYGSEFRYRQPLLGRDTLVLAVTQSGETVDTLAAMEEARAQGVPSVAIVNVIGSQAARVADGGSIYLHCGPEIGVASTKAFTSMLVAAYVLALRLAQARGRLDSEALRGHIQGLLELPGKLSTLLEETRIYEELAERYHRVGDMLFLGRWVNYPIALEGALKLKEISYVHAEGYPAGEMKHGPIALIDEQMPVVCIAPRDAVYAKMLSNIEQVKARHGRVIAVGTQGDAALAEKADDVLWLPECAPLLTPVLATVPLQLLAYHFALQRGCDVDQPRNLAKSVTVE
jgi:glucosamine--fructose-6-phosphate aminotransferase (isomerizing)